MNYKVFISSIISLHLVVTLRTEKCHYHLHTDQSEQIIPKEIYGQFAGHLGTCIYGAW